MFEVRCSGWSTTPDVEAPESVRRHRHTRAHSNLSASTAGRACYARCVSLRGAAAYDYIRDDERRVIRVTIRERHGAEELMAIVDRQAGEGTWTYGMLYDLRALQTAIPREDAALVSDHVATHVDAHGRRGPVAIVTRHADGIGSAQRYAIDGAKHGVTVQVFWDLDEAEAWLASTASPEPRPRTSRT
jgi:hypothetical protein